MSAEEVLAELKIKALPTYGTNLEKKNRLKKAHGKNNIEYSLDIRNYSFGGRIRHR